MIDRCLLGFHHHSEEPEVLLALLENEGDNKNPFGQTECCVPGTYIEGCGQGVVH